MSKETAKKKKKENKRKIYGTDIQMKAMGVTLFNTSCQISQGNKDIKGAATGFKK